MKKKLKYVLWILIPMLVVLFLLVHYEADTSAIIGIMFNIGLLEFACYGLYLKVTEKDRATRELLAVQNRVQSEYRAAIAPFYDDMRKNYYNLFSELSIPADAAKIDVETTVFGLPCLALPTAGQAIYYKKDFYMRKDGTAICIFPTEEHLTDAHIKYRTRTPDLPAKLNPNDIALFKINIADIEYYLISGQETSEFKVEGGGSSGPSITGAIVGGLLAGEAGAVIGGMPKPEPVYTYTKYNEGRCVELVYKENERVQKIKLSYPAFPFLERWMPEKEYSYIIAHSRINNG